MSQPVILVGLIGLVCNGCGLYLDSKISDYRQVSETINIGDTKSQVLAKLPDQASLGKWGKPREATVVDGKMVEIYYFRSRRIPDGLTTDAEFTPYLFIDDRLSAIGWRAMEAFDITPPTGQTQ